MVNKYQKYLIICCTLIVLFAELFFRLKGIPILTGDAVWFYPIAENFSQYRGLIHPVMSPISDGGGPLIWHGWLHPYIIGLFGRLFSDPFLGVTISETTLVGLGCLIFSWVIASTNGRNSVLIKTSVVISVVVMSFSFLGRPESIAFFLLVIGLGALQYFERSALKLGSIALLWGGIGATQPTVALLVGFALLGYFIISDPSPRSALVRWVVIGALSVSITFLLTLTIYPHSPIEWIEGLWMHSQKIANRGDSSRLLYYFMLQPSRFMQGGWFVLAAICGAVLLWQYDKIRDWWLLGIALVGIGVAWYTSIRIPPTRYNLFALFPLFVISIYYSVDKIKNKKIYLFVKSSILVLGIFSILIAGRRYMVLSRSILGTGCIEVANSVRELPRSSEISMDSSILFSCYKPDTWTDFNVMRSKLPRKNDGKYAVVKQSALGRINAPKIEKNELLTETFNEEKIYFGPIKIANTDDSYNFAIYERRD